VSGILLVSVGNSYGSAPVNTVAPVVSGTATVGQTLTTTNGTWTGAPAPTFTYQWQRTGVDIGGATSSTYVLVAADYANTIRCVVRATNSIAPSGVTANSNSTASVAGTAPVNTVAPAVTGTASFGFTLTTTNGTWTGAPTPTFTYQWQRVTTNISGATSSTYVLVAADVGNTIRCVVTATNAVSAVSANSNSTASVAAVVPGAPTIGTATAATSTTASVPFTQPASNGGSTITSYTATSTPSSITGTLNQAGSGTITVSGLATGTAYTFTVKATNAIGQSAASAASNSVTPALVPGEAFGGGYFGGQISTGATGIADYNLVVAPASASGLTTYLLSFSNSAPLTPSVIDGPGNSVTLAATGTAAPFCNNLVVGGFSDWYLPANKELNVVYFYLKPNGNNNSVANSSNIYAVPSRPNNNTAGNPAQTSVAAFQTGGAEAFSLQQYWSSTSYDATYGSAINFESGGLYAPVFRYFGKVLRAFRRVAV